MVAVERSSGIGLGVDGGRSEKDGEDSIGSRYFI